MIEKSSNLKSISENQIIEKYLKKLNFGKKESFGFNNDASYLNSFKGNKHIVTNDSIVENVDFFKNDNPKSIAQKIVTSNLCMPKYITINWLESFSSYLIKLQKKYNFFLLGGDLSKSKQLMISSTFFGNAKYKNIIHRNHININDDIWVTGNLGESYAGLKILKTKVP